MHDDEEGINAIFGGTPASCLVAMHSPEAAPPGCTIEALEKYSALLKKIKGSVKYANTKDGEPAGTKMCCTALVMGLEHAVFRGHQG